MFISKQFLHDVSLKGYSIAALFLIFVAFCSVTNAQYGQPKDYIRDESNQGVDLYSGRVNFSIPVIQINGRGKAATSLNVNIPQSQWKVVELDRYYHPQTAQLLYVDYLAMPSMAELLSPPILQPPSVSLETKGDAGAIIQTGISNVIVFKDSDGKKFELRDDIKDGNFSPLGLGIDAPSNDNCRVYLYNQNQPIPVEQVQPPSQSCNRGKIFRSKDGSGITYVADNDIYDAIYVNPYPAAYHFADGKFSKTAGTLYLSNGTKYRFDEHDYGHGRKQTNLVYIEDRNGNRTTFTYWENPGCDIFNNCFDWNIGKLIKIKDSINREIVISYGDSTQDSYVDTVIYKGFNGNEKQIKIHHGKLANALKPGQSLKTYHELFPTVGRVSFNHLDESQESELNKFEKVENDGRVSTNYHNPGKITAITLPDNRQYVFQYNSYGELSRVISPLESYTDYQYGAINDSGADGYGVVYDSGQFGVPVPWQIYRRGAESKKFDESGNLQAKITYSGAGGINPVVVKQFDTDDTTVLSASKHYFITEGAPPLLPSYMYMFQYVSWKENREYKTEILDPLNQNNVLRKIETHWEQRAPVSWWENPTTFLCPYEPQNDPRATEIKTTLETGQVAKKTLAYDQFNNVTDVYEYDYGVGQAGQFLRRNHTDYVTDSNYTSHAGAHLRALPLETWISSDAAGGNKVSLMRYEYDNYSANALVSRTNVAGHNSINYGTSYTRRGNITKSISYIDAQNPNQTNAVATQTQYDILGNVVKTIDAKGYITTIDFSDRFGSPDGEARGNWDTQPAPIQLNGQNTFAFQTSTTNPLGYAAYSQFDYYSGLIVDSEDVNENVSTTFYNDALDRPTQVITANNRPALRSQTTTVYEDINRKVTVTTDLYSFNDNQKKTVTFYNGLGRTTETRSYETGGYAITSDPQYDGLGRVIQTVNPYRPYLNEQPVWTTTSYDGLGRVVKVKTPDNAEATTSYSGNAATLIDQAGKKRRSITNAIEQLTRVDEPNNVNELGDVSNPLQATHYSYNPAGNLVKVSQGQQNRFFLYDSLGRLVRVRQPEQNTNPALAVIDPVTGNNQWSAGSTYDANGNVLTTTDAKAVVTTYSYDDLNRPLTRTYSDGTPTVTHEYDNASVPFSRGQLTKISSAVSETRYTQFDALGRIKASAQLTTPEQRNGTQAPYSMSYAYNLSGALVEEIYPSNRVVKNDYDNDGRLSYVTSKAGVQTDFHLYAGNFAYNASGAVSRLRLGNGLWESAQFNSRLQITQIGLGSSQDATNLWKVNYDYGKIEADGTLDALKNNGNIARQSINFSGLSQSFVQTYQYDSLNRLSEAKEMSGAAQLWLQNFNYDRYGNRTSFSQQKLGEQELVQTPTVDPATNRFTGGQGFVYDFNGNLVTDNQGRQFTFNGDNKQVEVKDAADNVIGLYYYDGKGARIKKISASETTIFVYNAFGKVVAEYSTQTAANPTISYLTNDMLGSPRVITDNGGVVISRRDFMPFGGDLIATQNRTESNKYDLSGDAVRKKFTGYEKDAETGLDFAEARMYDNNYGRFTAVDPLIASGLSAHPQTFNRYIYVANNPITLTDPTGMFIEAWSHGGMLFGLSSQMFGDPFQSISKADRENAFIDKMRDSLSEVAANPPPSISVPLLPFNDKIWVPQCSNGKCGPFIFTEEALAKFGTPEDPKDQPLVGNGDCGILPQRLANDERLGQAEWWRGAGEGNGTKVFGNNNIQKGTVIATLVEGRYPNAASGTSQYNSVMGNHVAIYWSQGVVNGAMGIWVIDQYPGRGNAGFRFIRAKGGSVNENMRPNNAHAFYVVYSIAPSQRTPPVKAKINGVP
jgi:RHS repeat-associated protein